MGELYLDDIDRYLLERYRLSLDVYRPKEAENAAGGYHSGALVPIQEPQLEPSADDEFTCAS
jgi:hypothetical protein